MVRRSHATVVPPFFPQHASQSLRANARPKTALCTRRRPDGHGGASRDHFGGGGGGNGHGGAPVTIWGSGNGHGDHLGGGNGEGGASRGGNGHVNLEVTPHSCQNRTASIGFSDPEDPNAGT